MTLKDLCKRLGVSYSGQADLELSHVCGFEAIGPGALAFVMDSKALPTPGGVFNQKKLDLAQLAAETPCAVIVPEGTAFEGLNLIFAKDPLALHCQAAELLQPAPKASGQIHPKAVVEEGANIAQEVTIDAGAVVYAGAAVGKGTVLRAGVVLMPGAQVGAYCLLHPNVVIGADCQVGDRSILHAGAVIGADGYGFFQRDGQNHKIPQKGIVVIEEDVEIGANTCIDRARFSLTKIGAGCKLDNLVHIAHNVEVGAHSLITAQSGIAGSTTTGERLMMGGQSGIRDNLQIGKGVTLLARTLVTSKAEDGQILAGMPGRPIDKWRHQQASLSALDRLIERLGAIESFLKKWGFGNKK